MKLTIYIRLAFLFTFAFPVQAQAQKCGDLKPSPTQIKIDLELPDPFYDLKQDLAAINKGHTSDDWLIRHNMQKVWKSSDMERLGYAEGATAIMSHFGLEARHFDDYGVYYCPYVKYIDVAMMLRTRIVIPTNFKKGGCRFNLIHEHELRHYNANRDVTADFVKRLYHDLPVIINEMENAQPYVLGAQVPATMERLKAEINDAIEGYIVEALGRELTRRNDLIDTPEEYASSGPKMLACPD